MNTPAELHASKGDTATLSCTFSSTTTPTSKMTIDWSYRPQTGGPPQTVSIHSSVLYENKAALFSAAGKTSRRCFNWHWINLSLPIHWLYTEHYVCLEGWFTFNFQVAQHWYLTKALFSGVLATLIISIGGLTFTACIALVVFLNRLSDVHPLVLYVM